MECKECGGKMTIEEDWLDEYFRGHVWFCESCGIDQKASRHVHTRNCYDDPGPGHGSPFLICGKVEGEFE